MFDMVPHKRVVVALGLIVVLAMGGVAVAYFTASGSGTGSVTAGEASNWAVTFDAPTGTMYPGAGSTTLAYTVTNPSAGHQQLAGTTATVVDDGSGNIKDGGVAVPDCLSAWFVAANSGPAAVDLAGGASATGSIEVTMINAAASQDACQGKHPDIQVNAS